MYQPSPTPEELTSQHFGRELRRIADAIAALAARLRKLDERVADLEEDT